MSSIFKQLIRKNKVISYRDDIFDLLYQEQMGATTSNTENMETQSVSEEQFLQQQINELLLELYQDTQGEHFNCQEECNTLTEEFIFSISCKSNNCVLLLAIYT